MDDDRLCESILNIDDNILGVGVIQDGDLISYAKKQLMPFPREEKLRQMLVQTSLIMKMSIDNDDFFGTTNFILHNHSKLNIGMFPLNYSPLKILVVTLIPTTAYEKLLNGINQFISRTIT